VNPAAALWARSILRRHWRATFLLVVFIAVVGASVMTAWEYSRRADTVIARRTAAGHLADGTFQSCPPGVDPSTDLALCNDLKRNQEAYDVLLRSPHVAAAKLFTSAAITVSGRDGQPRSVLAGVLLASHGSVGTGYYVTGREAEADNPDQATVSEYAARSLGVSVGDPLPVTACDFDLSQGVKACEDHTTVHVVGISRSESDLVPALSAPPGVGGRVPDYGVIVSAAWYRLHGTKGYLTTNFTLAPGATIDDVRADLYAALPQWTMLVSPYEDSPRFTALARSTGLQARAIWIIAMIVLAAGTLFVGQTIVRQLRRELVDRPAFTSLGADRRLVTTVVGLRFAGIAVAAAAIAGAAAAGLSTFGPTGIAGRAEVQPGFRLDWTVLALGTVGVVLVTMLVAIAATLAIGRPSSLADTRRVRWVKFGGPPALLVGTRRFGNGLWVGVIGVAAAVATAGAAGTLVASLHRVESHPVRYGAAWDYTIALNNEGQVAEASKDPLITDLALLTETGPFTLPGIPTFWMVSLQGVRGDIAPVMVSGRAPIKDDEIALAPITLRAMNKHLGDTMAKANPGAPVGPFRIVGEVLISSVTPSVGPGSGALVTESARAKLDPATSPYLVVRTDPSVPQSTVVAHLDDKYGTSLTVPGPQDDLRNLRLISAAPWTIAGLVAALAAATLGHALSVSVRRRRHDFAVLRTLGFTSGQVHKAVSWRALLAGACAVVVGVPVGVIGGRWAWHLVAHDVGLASAPVVPIGWALIPAAGALALAVLISVGPGLSAGHRRLVDLLRAE
jgi:ABC-type lipoprotein release transport system permease subunit